MLVEFFIMRLTMYFLMVFSRICCAKYLVYWCCENLRMVPTRVHDSGCSLSMLSSSPACFCTSPCSVYMSSPGVLMVASSSLLELSLSKMVIKSLLLSDALGKFKLL